MSQQPKLPAGVIRSLKVEVDVQLGDARLGSTQKPGRVNKTARTHFLPPDYWRTLEELAFRTRDEKGKRTPQEKMMAEALNLLFAKYNYPLVNDK